MSSLALVLLILILGTLMLAGLNQQLDSFTALVGRESQSIQRQAAVQTALEWGKGQSWLVQPDPQCRQNGKQRVCFRVIDESHALLTAGSGDLLLWRAADIKEGKILFSPHGWADFCPRPGGELCQLP